MSNTALKWHATENIRESLMRLERKVNGRPYEQVDLREFGARSTSDFDNTSALSKAMTQLSNAGGGVLRVPDGTFKHTGFTVASNVSIIGNGMGRSVLDCTSAGNAITWSGTDADRLDMFQLAGLHIKGPLTRQFTAPHTVTSATSTTIVDAEGSYSAGQLNGMWARVIAGTGLNQAREITDTSGSTLTVDPAWTTPPDSSSRFVVESHDCTMVLDANGDPTRCGVFLRYTRRYADGKQIITGCKVSGFVEDGIYWTFGDNLTVSDSIITRNGQYGVHTFELTNSLDLVACAVSHNRTGVYVNQVSSNQRISCGIHDNYQYGIIAQNCDAPQIDGCEFNRNGLAAINLVGHAGYYVAAPRIVGNLFGDNGIYSAAGSQTEIVMSFTKGAYITGNYFYGVNQDRFIRIADENQGYYIGPNHWHLDTGITRVSLASPASSTSQTGVWHDHEDTGNKIFTELRQKTWELLTGSAANVLLQGRIARADANPRWRWYGSGKSDYGDGTNPPDVTLERPSAGRLQITPQLEVGGLFTALSTKTGAYTITGNDSTIIADANGGAFTVTLPSAVSRSGRLFTIKKFDGTANVVTIATDGSETIDGLATQSLAAQWDAITVQSNGFNWLVVSRT